MISLILLWNFSSSSYLRLIMCQNLSFQNTEKGVSLPFTCKPMPLTFWVIALLQSHVCICPLKFAWANQDVSYSIRQWNHYLPSFFFQPFPLAHPCTDDDNNHFLGHQPLSSVCQDFVKMMSMAAEQVELTLPPLLQPKPVILLCESFYTPAHPVQPAFVFPPLLDIWQWIKASWTL